MNIGKLFFTRTISQLLSCLFVVKNIIDKPFLKRRPGTNYINIAIYAYLFGYFVSHYILFCYFCTWFPLSYQIGRCTTPVRSPTVKVRLKSTPCWNMRWYYQMLRWVLGGRSRHNDKAFYWRFVLDAEKLRNFPMLVRTLQRWVSSGCVYIRILYVGYSHTRNSCK